jgi:hypothetical protein
VNESDCVAVESFDGSNNDITRIFWTCLKQSTERCRFFQPPFLCLFIYDSSSSSHGGSYDLETLLALFNDFPFPLLHSYFRSSGAVLILADSSEGTHILAGV